MPGVQSVGWTVNVLVNADVKDAETKVETLGTKIKKQGTETEVTASRQRRMWGFVGKEIGKLVPALTLTAFLTRGLANQFNLVGDTASAGLDVAFGALTNFFNWLKEEGPKAIGSVGDAFKGIFEKAFEAGQGVRGMFDSIMAGAFAAGQTTREVVGGAFAWILEKSFEAGQGVRGAFDSIMAGAFAAGQTTREVVGGAFAWILEKAFEAGQGVRGAFDAVWERLQETWGTIADYMDPILERFKNAAVFVFQQIGNAAKAAWDWIVKAAQTTFQAAYGAGQAVGSAIRTRQVGGMIPTTGLYMLHRGERVTPATGVAAGRGEGGMAGGAPTININITGPVNLAGGMDIQRLASQLSQDIYQELRRVMR